MILLASHRVGVSQRFLRCTVIIDCVVGDKRDGKVQIRSGNKSIFNLSSRNSLLIVCAGAKSFPIMNLVWCFSMAVVAL